MQTPVLSGYRWKTKDLERLPEEPFLSYEIIDGELVVSRKPHLRHAAIIGKFCAQSIRVSEPWKGYCWLNPALSRSRNYSTEPTHAPPLAQAWGSSAHQERRVERSRASSKAAAAADLSPIRSKTWPRRRCNVGSLGSAAMPARSSRRASW